MLNPTDSSDSEHNESDIEQNNSDTEMVSSAPVTPEMRPMNPREQVERELRLLAIGTLAPNPYNPQREEQAINDFIRERLAIFDALGLEERQRLLAQGMPPVLNRINLRRGGRLIQDEFALPPPALEVVRRHVGNQQPDAGDPQGRDRDRQYGVPFFPRPPANQFQQRANPEAEHTNRERRYHLIRRALFNNNTQPLPEPQQHSDSSESGADIEPLMDASFNRKR